MKTPKLSNLFTLVLVVIFCYAGSGDKTTSNKSLTEFQKISDDSLLSLVQYQTFQYFWSGAEPVSGMARERFHVDGLYPENDMNVVTSGGSGFGLMAILVGIKRGFITRSEAVDRFTKIVEFLKKAERFHGAWSHWIYDESGKVKPFSPKDDGADIVETAYLMQGLLCVRQYFVNGSEKEKLLSSEIDTLWREVEWNWFTKGRENVLYWHWSPDYDWAMNFPVTGYNECIILYILAASSPTFPINAEVYHKGWAQSGAITIHGGKYGYTLNLRHNGAEEYGGPLYWAHYSYLGLDPRFLKDKYADYWQENKDQTLINWTWCSLNPNKFSGYSDSCWGLTASYSMNGYAAHAPGETTDLGVISPTAALSSFPYTPEQSMSALKHFYYNLGNKLWGKYGFYDAFSEQNSWFPQRYLAIDQGPVVIMIENYRTGMLWNLFMSSSEIQGGLKLLGFTWNEKHLK
jgi:hypothetical protein